METCRFVEITDKELIEFVEDKENPNTKRKIRPRTKSIVIQKNFIQTSNSDLLVQQLFMSFHHKFWKTAFRNSSLISFRKKDGSD